jgi:protein-L-isoaspartate O-methyltransferase
MPPEPSPDQRLGNLLQAVSLCTGAKRVLEIGCGSGASTLSLASVMPADGLLIAIETDPSLAAEARHRFAAAGFAGRISVIVGDASRFLHKVRGPFDVIFLDVDGLDHLRGRLVALLRQGGVLITADRKYSGEGGGPGALSLVVKDMTIAEWLATAKADAEKRGLSELIPMLEGLAQATERLRAADWNENPDQDTPFDPPNLAQDKPRDDDH